MGTRILLTSAVRSARPSGVAGGHAGTQGACSFRPSREEPPDVRRAQHREPAARRCLRTATRAISSAAAPSLAVGEGRWIVYPVDTDIRVLNTRRNRVRILATLAHPPRQVLALRGRAIWLAGTGIRIVAMPLS
jgi:hypothetical protein